ncbi:MAG: electron transport complex subunit RsxC [Synergistaceae bacterium]|nr:electron transport complex subunit RsxC [Synergistaceae bacterium]MBQ6114217.1 electron transport complex subunit RsxC [Synergistaceae bacterium]MBQ6982753.1 electron transport complex subunit RsxC [Synergistaceae bacterium]
MNLPTFIGGVHPPEGKALTESKAVEILRPEDSREFVYPLALHIGAPCSPIVKKGDSVLAGQKIADTDAFVSAPKYSAVSGVVKAIEPRMAFTGAMEQSIVIESDGKYTPAPSLHEALGHKPKPSDYVKLIREAGLVGLGGACFPTHVKLSPPKDKVIQWVIVNAAECEPYLTCDNRLMLDSPDEILKGLEFVLEIFPEAKGVIGIESNKPEAIATMTEHNKNPKITVMPLKVKYPQGAEKMLIWSVTGREVPLVPALPADVGCIVLNTRTTWQIYKAIAEGKPVTERIVTVTGDAIAEPKNLQVPLGLNVRELIHACGGFKEEPVKVISGGPMMGIAMRSIDVPVVKGTSGILALTKNLAYLAEESACIRCGKCVEVCPMHLEPTLLDHAVRLRDYEKFEAHLGMNCIECGSCSYICPASRHLAQALKEGKASVNALRKKAAAQAKAKQEAK